jgi:hypothetical protein
MDRRNKQMLPPGWEAVVDRMVLIDPDDEEHPAEFTVCWVCEGHGKYVNPSIDSDGISPEQFAEDPEFARSYFAGAYDIQCRSCGGRRVELTPIEDEAKKSLAEDCQFEADWEAEREAERRMGC